VSGQISIRKAMDDYLAICAVRLRPMTMCIQRGYLQHHFLEWLVARRVFDLRAVTSQHLEEYRVFLTTAEHRWRDGTRKIAACTRVERFVSVRRFFAWCVRTRLLIVDPAATIVARSRNDGSQRTFSPKRK